MNPLLRTLLVPLTLATAGPVLSAPLVVYEASVPVAAIEGALGAGVFDAAPFFTADRFVLRMVSDLRPAGSVGVPLPAPIQTGDGFNTFNGPFASGFFNVNAVLQGVNASGLPVSRQVGDLADDLSTDSEATLIVKDAFNGATPDDEPAFLLVTRFVFQIFGDASLPPEEFELRFHQTTDDVLSTNLGVGGPSFLRLSHLNRGTEFLTSDFELRLTQFVPDGGDTGPGGGTVPEPTALTLAAVSLALMACVTRGRRQRRRDRGASCRPRAC